MRYMRDRRWAPGRATMAAFAMVALLLRLVAPLASTHARSIDELLADPHYLCLGATAESSGDAPAAPAHPHEDCGDCCLNFARVVLHTPDIFVLVSPAAEGSTVVSPPVAAQGPRGPPAEAWSTQRAQRAPPTI